MANRFNENQINITINKRQTPGRHDELSCLEDVETILCQHCLRTSSNGIKCLGMCVADNDY